MSNVSQSLIREPGASRPDVFGRRVLGLAGVYLALFVASVAGILLLVWQGQLFVTLAQRSNVETLTLAFLLVFFGYLAVLSAPGALGALRVFSYEVRRRSAKDPTEIDRTMMRALGPAKGEPAMVMLGCLLEREDQPFQAIRFAVQDAAGNMGTIEVDGARVRHLPACKDGSTDLLAFFAEQVRELLQKRHGDSDLEIVEWGTVDDEATIQFYGLTEFARRLEQRLGEGPFWPKATLIEDDCAELERRLAEVCPALRSEGFLPKWEYTAEHKLPVIPEPLGIISLGRSERRADPVSSMGCALLVVLFVVLVVSVFIFFPPWTPGK